MSTVTDPIADLLARLRNSTQAQKLEMYVPFSKVKNEVVRILKEEGYIADYQLDTTGAHPRIKITNKISDRTSAITGLPSATSTTLFTIWSGVQPAARAASATVGVSSSNSSMRASAPA